MPDGPALPHEITVLLSRWNVGDRQALEEVVALAYPNLRAIAQGHLQRSAAGHTLQATGLVHELYIRLSKARSAPLKDRSHFYAFAAQLMRLILIDYARRTRAQKRPDSTVRIPLHEEMAWIDAAGEEMLTLNLLLDELEKLDARKVRAIELRYFLGCTNEEAADLLQVSRPTIDRDLDFAKSWLYRKLTSGPGGARHLSPDEAAADPGQREEPSSNEDK